MDESTFKEMCLCGETTRVQFKEMFTSQKEIANAIIIFDNRVEIVSPGALAGGLTVDDIRNGKTYQRNPYMATFATNALHYRGIGSGIVRVLTENPDIELTNDVDGKEFRVTIWRTPQKVIGTIQKENITIQKENITIQKKNSTIQKENNTIQKKDSTIQKNLEPSQMRLLEFFSNHPHATIEEAVDAIENLSLGGVKFVIGKLQQKGLLKRVGGRKHGEWMVLYTEME